MAVQRLHHSSCPLDCQDFFCLTINLSLGNHSVQTKNASSGTWIHYLFHSILKSYLDCWSLKIHAYFTSHKSIFSNRRFLSYLCSVNWHYSNHLIQIENIYQEQELFLSIWLSKDAQVNRRKTRRIHHHSNSLLWLLFLQVHHPKDNSFYQNICDSVKE